MSVFFIAVLLVVSLATSYVSADDNLRNCNGDCESKGEYEYKPVCVTEDLTKDGPFVSYFFYPNACHLKIHNCRYPTASK